MIGLLPMMLQLVANDPLEVVRLHLERGDTAGAVDALRPYVHVGRDSLTGGRVVAALLLQWIGRSSTQGRAAAAWRAAGDGARRANDPAPAIGVLAIARMLETDALVESDHLERRDAWLADVAAFGGRDAYLADAAQWVRVQQLLVLMDRWSSPGYRTLPLHCHGQVFCTIREPPPRGATLVGRTDSAGRPLLDQLRSVLAVSRATRWPISELAARVRVALEAVVGDSARLGAAAHDTAGLPPRAARELRAIALTLTGDLPAAWATMAEDSTHFLGLDSVLPAPLATPSLSARTFWWVAWPLYLQPYNERLAVHRARVLLSDLLERSRAFGLWADRDRLIRVGVPLGLELVREGTPGYDRDVDLVVTYVPSTLRETLVRLTEPADAPPLDLALTARDDEVRLTARSGFAPRAYDDFGPFEHQAFQYVRDGGRVVDFHGLRPAPRGRLCAAPAGEVGFFVQDAALKPIGEKRERPDSARSRFFFRILPAAGQYVYSLEYLDEQCRFAARARHVLLVEAPANALSGLILVDSLLVDEPRRVSGDPAAVVRPSRRVTPGSPIHLYWEVYGLGPEAAGRRLTVTVEILTVARQRVPIYQLSRLLPRARGSPQTMLRYQLMVPGGAGPFGIPLSLQLSGEVTGILVVRVAVTDPALKTEHRAERPFSIEPAVELIRSRD
jgi:hypothetical protein